MTPEPWTSGESQPSIFCHSHAIPFASTCPKLIVTGCAGVPADGV